MAIVCGDDPVIKELIPEFSRPYITYGFNQYNDYVLSNYHSKILNHLLILNQNLKI